MKKLILILFLRSVCWGYVVDKPIMGVQLNYGHDLSRGLVGAWLFNDRPGVVGKTYDLSGNGNHGDLEADTTSIPGKYGNALDFDGTDDSVDCGTGSSLDVGPGDFTFVALVKIDVKATDKEILVKGLDVDFIDLRWDAVFDAFAWSIDDGAFQQIYHQTTPTIGQWHHLVGVRRGTASVIYVDGVVSDTTGTIGTVVDLSARAFIIGRQGESASRFWDGQIDHAYVYNRALTSREITSLMMDPFQMFEQEGVVVNVAPAAGGQVITVIMTSIPGILVLGLAFAFLRRKAV